MQHSSGDSYSPRLAVLVSGHARGSNLQALIDAERSQIIQSSVVLVIGTNADSAALQRARDAGIDTVVISPNKPGRTEEQYSAALLKALTNREVDVVCLLGYMRRLPAAIVAQYKHKVLNIHPSLLPLFGGKGMFGLNVHSAVIESGVKVTGATVHLVDEEYDTGPIVVQRVVDVLDDDTPEILARRVLDCEHAAIIEAVRLVCETGIVVLGRRVTKTNQISFRSSSRDQ